MHLGKHCVRVTCGTKLLSYLLSAAVVIELSFVDNLFQCFSHRVLFHFDWVSDILTTY